MKPALQTLIIKRNACIFSDHDSIEDFTNVVIMILKVVC